MIFGDDSLFEIVLHGGTSDLALMSPIVITMIPATAEVVEAVTSVSAELEVPAGSIVDRATVLVRAWPPLHSKVGDVAETRDDPNGVVIDFGRMRSVNRVAVSGATVTTVAPWLGTQFQAGFESSDDDGARTFSEVSTERLLIGTSAGHAKVATDGTVDLTSGPTDLDLLVGGRRAWFHPNEAKRAAIGTTPAPDDYFVALIDVTEAVTTAARTAVKVPIELRAATAAVLEITPAITIQRVHPVGFPEGPERPVSFAIEGTGTLTLPLSPAAPWSVYGVAMKVASRIGPARGLFPAHVPHSTDAELVLDADHSIAIQIGGDQLSPFVRLTGARLEVYVEAGGAELAAVLLRDASGAPGAPLEGGELLPATLTDAPRDAGVSAWATLSSARPVVLPGGPLWIAFQVSRGTLVVPLAQTGGGAVRRAIPGGEWREFSKAVDVVPRATVRVIGEAPEGAPIHALGVQLGTGAVQVVTPSQEGTVITVRPPATTEGAPGSMSVTGPITLGLTTTAPGTYRFSDVQVFYRLSSEEPAP